MLNTDDSSKMVALVGFTRREAPELSRYDILSNPEDNDMNHLIFLFPGKTKAKAAEYFATYNGLLNSMEGHGLTLNFVMHRSQLKKNKKATKSLQPRKC